MAIVQTAGSVDYKIDKIYVNGIAGSIFGGSIFDCKLSAGFSSSPTKLTLSVIEPEGNYQIAEDETDAIDNNYPYPSYLTPWIIQVGEGSSDTSPMLLKMYLESWATSTEAGSKVLEATFVDGSSLLDRIFVGLIDKHIDANLENMRQSRLVEFTLPVVCETLDGDCGDLNQFGNCTGLVDRSETRTMKQKGGFGIRRGERREEGGAMFLGFHEVNTKNVSQDCAVPKVTYSFSDLLYLMSRPESAGGFGIEIANKYGTELPSLWDRDPFYRKDYFGTLRKVLNDWCADFGFEPIWSFGGEGIIGIDRSSDVDIVSALKKKIDNISGQPIKDISYEVSKKGTKKNYLVTSVIRAAQTQDSNRTLYQKAVFMPLDFSHFLHPAYYGNRTELMFRISIGLSRFSTTQNYIREIFNASIGAYEALGYTVHNLFDCSYQVQSPEQDPDSGAPKASSVCDGMLAALVGEERIKSFLQTKNFWSYQTTGNPDDAPSVQNFPLVILLVEYSEDVANYYKKLEQGIANGFVGRYYANFNRIENFARCGLLGSYIRQDTITPSCKTFTWDDKFALPFSGLFSDPLGMNINPSLFNLYPEMNIHDRGMLTTWGTTNNQVKALFASREAWLFSAEQVMKRYTPEFIPLAGAGLAWMSGLSDSMPSMQLDSITYGPPDLAGFPTIAGASPSDVKKLLYVLNRHQQSARGSTQVGLLIHPNYNHPSWCLKYMNFTNVGWYNCSNILTSLSASYSEARKKFNDRMNRRDVPNQSGNCKDLCSFNPEQEICAKYYKLAKDYPYTEGIMGRDAFCFQINWDSRGLGLPYSETIIFPPSAPILGNHKIDLKKKMVQPAVKEIFDNLDTPGDIEKIDVKSQDVGNIIYQNSGKVEVQIPKGVTWAARRRAGQLLTSVMQSSKIELDSHSVQEFHDSMVGPEGTLANTNVTVNQKTLGFSTAGFVFENSILPYVTRPDLGLQSMNVSVGAEGVTTSFEFSNRSFRELSRDVLMDQVGVSATPISTSPF